MATFQSVQSNTSNNTGSVVITKPTSLAVGDWMVACIWADRDSGSTATLGTPAGWTAEETWKMATSTAAMAIYTKVADSADVAASNFTFSGGGSTGNMHMIGHLARITGVAFKDNSSMSADDTTGSSITAPSVTQTYANSLYLGFFGASDTGGIPAATTFVIATSNPTWTNQASSTVDDGTTDSRLTFYTATRPEVTDTGTLTGTTTVLASNRGAVGFISLAARVDGSITPTQTNAVGYVFTPIQSVVIEAETVTPTLETITPTIWTPVTKS
jgi:hypothetical protein